MAKRSALWSYTIAGWSGFYVMLVELLSGRLIAPSFGSSIYVWGSVIFIFMLGLSIGYLLGGIYSRYKPSVPRLCGILLTGANYDGAEGLAGIRIAGGLAVVQDPATAEVATMPGAAIRRMPPDLILPLADIAALLLALGRTS